MQKMPRPIEQAVLMPPTDLLLRFASYFRPEAPLSYVLKRFVEVSQTDSLFKVVDHDRIAELADIIQEVSGLSTEERLIFCNAPTKTQYEELQRVAREYARCVANKTDAVLTELKEVNLEILDSPARRDEVYLIELEKLHIALTLYLWLSYRFSGIFVTQALAFHTKSLVEEKIERFLATAPLQAPAESKVIDNGLQTAKGQERDIEETSASQEPRMQPEPPKRASPAERSGSVEKPRQDKSSWGDPVGKLISLWKGPSNTINDRPNT